MNKGWVKLHRKIQASNMYKALNSKQRDVMMQILLLANHDNNEWEWNGDLFKCKPGQFVTSLESLRQLCASDVSVQSVRTALLKLEKWHFLTNESTKSGRLITIVNWQTYQNMDDEINKPPNKELTKNQQRTNKELTTNKNDKEVKNEKKYIYGEFENVKLTKNEYEKLKERFGDKLEHWINTLSEGIELKGYKYKSHYLAIIKWSNRENNQNKKFEYQKTKDEDFDVVLH